MSSTEPAGRQSESPQGKDEAFIFGIIKSCNESKGFGAQLKRADNPATEYQCWEALARYNIDLERSYIRLPYVTVASFIARSKASSCGAMTLGQALARSFPDGNKSKQATTRLRRLLACHDTEEVCRILRPMLSLIASRVTEPLDTVRLLKQLRRFPFYDDQVKSQWAQEFFSYERDEEAAK